MAGELKSFFDGKIPLITLGKSTIRPRRVPAGGLLSFEVALHSICKKPQRLAVQLAVEFPGARAVRRKVFRLATLELESGQAETLRGSVGLAPLTARRGTPGRHHVDLLVNGVAFPLGGFAMVARRRGR